MKHVITTLIIALSLGTVMAQTPSKTAGAAAHKVQQKKDAATKAADAATVNASDKAASAAKKAESTAKTTGAAVEKKKAEAKKAKQDLLDLNSATQDQIAALPGIGQETASKIVAARPFRAKNELVSRKLITKETYEQIKPLVIAKQAAKK